MNHFTGHKHGRRWLSLVVRCTNKQRVAGSSPDQTVTRQCFFGETIPSCKAV